MHHESFGSCGDTQTVGCGCRKGTVPGPTARNMWHQLHADSDWLVGCDEMVVELIGHPHCTVDPRSEQNNENVKGGCQEVQNT